MPPSPIPYCRHFLVPMPMTAGSTPTTAIVTKRASGLRPSSLALERRMSSTAAAPSLTWGAAAAAVGDAGVSTAVTEAVGSRGRGGAHLARVARGAGAAFLERGRQARERLKGRVGARALICHGRHVARQVRERRLSAMPTLLRQTRRRAPHPW